MHNHSNGKNIVRVAEIGLVIGKKLDKIGNFFTYLVNSKMADKHCYLAMT
jgi:hypothetical protein